MESPGILYDVERARLVQAIAYFSARVKYPYLMKLLKLLYYLDFRHFRETGLPVTDLEYQAWKKGPVPPVLWEELRESPAPDIATLVVVRPIFRGGKLARVQFPHSRTEPDLLVFSPRQQRIMDKVIGEFKARVSTEMSEATHQPGSPWELTWCHKGEGAVIDYALALEGLPAEKKKRLLDTYHDHVEFRNYHREQCL